MLTNTGDMNTYAYKYKGYGHICLQIPGIHVGTHMLTNTGDMNTYAYKYQGYGHMLTNTRDMDTYAYKYQGYGHICLQRISTSCFLLKDHINLNNSDNIKQGLI